MSEYPNHAPDLNEMLALNQAHTAETSSLDSSALRALCQQAFFLGLRGAGKHAFLIALDQDARYSSPNFAWFKARRSRFIYVDRVIVASEMRGGGLARQLYEELFIACRKAGHDLVACEVNVLPPNVISEALHKTLAFEEVGQAQLLPGTKRVRYLVKHL